MHCGQQKHMFGDRLKQIFKEIFIYLYVFIFTGKSFYLGKKQQIISNSKEGGLLALNAAYGFLFVI